MTITLKTVLLRMAKIQKEMAELQEEMAERQDEMTAEEVVAEKEVADEVASEWQVLNSLIKPEVASLLSLLIEAGVITCQLKKTQYIGLKDKRYTEFQRMAFNFADVHDNGGLVLTLQSDYCSASPVQQELN